MSMKKAVLLAAAALSLVACGKTYLDEPVAQNSIGFNTWTNNLTKARVQGSNEFTDGDTFAVYGYKSMSDNTGANTVFNGVTVKTTDGTTWTYDTPRFWDSNYDKYTFFAVSPASAVTGGTVDAQTGEITSASFTFDGKNNDILVADKKEVVKGDGPTFFNGFATVPLQFNHVASLVDIKIKKAPAFHSATVSVTAFKLSNIENKGAFSVNDAYTDSHPVATWSSLGTGEYLPADGVLPLTIDEDTNFPSENAAAASDIIKSLIVKPQDFVASNGTDPQKITLSYKIAVGDESIEYNDKNLYLADFDVVDDADQNDTKIGSWEPGKHYTLYITIGANAISFSASISNWTPADNGYHYLVK